MVFSRCRRRRRRGCINSLSVEENRTFGNGTLLQSNIIELSNNRIPKFGLDLSKTGAQGDIFNCESHRHFLLHPQFA